MYFYNITNKVTDTQNYTKMEYTNYDLIETPKLVTLRDLEGHSLAIKKAMKHYDTTVATRVFINAMKDVPMLVEDLNIIRAKYKKLFDEHEKLKDEVYRYFDSEKRLKSLIK